MPILAKNLQLAIQLYLESAYPTPTGGVPPPIQEKYAPIMALPPDQIVPPNFFEKETANHILRLGQPMYPFMKLVIEPIPNQGPISPTNYLLRVDAHDRHLHAPEGSPDAAWLTSVRIRNHDLVEKIEAAWAKAGLPTFKEYLRQQLAARRARSAPGSAGGANQKR